MASTNNVEWGCIKHACIFQIIGLLEHQTADAEVPGLTAAYRMKLQNFVTVNLNLKSRWRYKKECL